MARANNYTLRYAELFDDGIPRQSLSSQLDDLTPHNWRLSKVGAACSRNSFRLDWLKSQTPPLSYECGGSYLRLIYAVA